MTIPKRYEDLTVEQFQQLELTLKQMWQQILQ
jgi:hypothetical protein